MYFSVILEEKDLDVKKRSVHMLCEEDVYKFLQRWGAKKQGLQRLVIQPLSNEETTYFLSQLEMKQ